MTEEQQHDLRQEMYAWCIVNGLAKDKEEAKLLLKENGFLTRPMRSFNKDPNKTPVNFKPQLDKANKRIKELSDEIDRMKSVLKTFKDMINSI